MRLAVEGWLPFVVGGEGLLTSTLELGVRRDGGDAEEGGRLLHAAPSGLSLEAVLRGWWRTSRRLTRSGGGGEWRLALCPG